MSRNIYSHWNSAPEGTKGFINSLNRYQGVPLEIDLGKIISQHNFAYDQATENWQTGLPLGNGDLAAMAYQAKNRLCWGLTKSEIRDLRHPVIPFHSHEEIRRVVEEEKDYLQADYMNEEEGDFRIDSYFPCFLPAGGINLIPIENAPDFSVKRQELDIYKANHKIELANGGKVESFVYHEANILALKLTGLKETKFEFKLLAEGVDPEIAAEIPGSNQNVADQMRREVFRHKTYSWESKNAEQKIYYADGNQALSRIEISGGCFENAQNDNAILSIQEDELIMFLTITSAREGAFLQRRLKRMLENTWQKNYERLKGDHENYWHDRWSRCVIMLPDQAVEKEWYFFVYTMAASSRGHYPVPLMSAWNLKFNQPYHGDYHNNINSQMCYWPVFAANQSDLAEIYIKHFWEILPEMEMETRKIFNMPGARIPFASVGGGKDYWGVGYWRYEFFCSAWTAQIAWWHYEYTKDLDFFKQYGWPLVKAVADFYIAYLEKDTDSGKWFLPLSKTVEDTIFNIVPSKRLIKDAGADLCAVHGHLADAVKAARELGLEDTAKSYEDVLLNLNPIPEQNGEYCIYKDCPLDLPVSHPYTIQPIYPTGLASNLSDEKTIEKAQKTLRNVWNCSSRVTTNSKYPEKLYWNDDLSMGWLGVSHAWMGNGNEALGMIRQGWLENCLLPNGFLSSQAAEPDKRPARMWMQNQLCGFANAVNEMLLQSHNGVIQVLPAIPDAWQKELTFIEMSARNNVKISASMKEGKVSWITVNARTETEIKLKDPWSELGIKDISAEDTSGESITLQQNGDIIAFKLSAGQVLKLSTT
jgi:alpha-L-fucosidase 2